MKKILLPFIIGVFVLGCRDEKDVDPANNATFMRYFGSEYNHTAVLAIEAHDGYTLLCNVAVPDEQNVGEFKYRMKVIHTDLNGHRVWQRSYPESEGVDKGYRAASFIPLTDGYVIVGEHIDQNNVSALHVTKINTNGEIDAETDFYYYINGTSNAEDQRSLAGHALTMDAAGNFILLGSIKTLSGEPNDMFISKVTLSGTSFTEVWRKEYGSTTGTLLNRLYVNSNQNIYWGGSYLNIDNTDFRLLSAPDNSLPTVDVFKGEKTVFENPLDFSETLGGFAVVGSVPNATTGNDIYFTKISYAGNELIAPKTIGTGTGLLNAGDFGGLNDKAVSVCPGQDGGYMILATVESGAGKGNGAEDYLLVKVNDFGDYVWDVNFGSSDKDEGVSVRQTTDGSYLVFGTATFGNEQKLMLMKVNSKGLFQ